jgi:serine/threonine protein kinase
MMVNRIKMIYALYMAQELKADTILRNRYKILSLLGKGGMAVTYLARDLHTKKEVAVKTLCLSSLDDWKVFDLFKREVAVLKELDHPRIPDYVDYFEETLDGESSFILVQEYVRGKTLYEIIKSSRHHQADGIKKILTGLLEILRYIHNLHPPLIHRDINPKNIIIDSSGTVFLVDFGAVGFMVKNTLAAAQSTTFVGTIGYIAPEQLYGKALPASDIYSLGITMVSLLTGKQPTELPLDGLEFDLREYGAQIGELAPILERMIQPDVKERFQSAEDVITALHRQQHGRKSGRLDEIWLPPPPRKLPLTTRILLWKKQAGMSVDMGLGFVFLGLVFVYVFVIGARLIPSLILMSADSSVRGRIIKVEGTSSSVNDVPVFKNTFEFTAADGRVYTQYSFTTGQRFTEQNVVTVLYVSSNPEYAVIEGARFSTFGFSTIFTIIFPIAGYVMLFKGTPGGVLKLILLLKKGTLTQGVVAYKERKGKRYRYHYKYTTAGNTEKQDSFVTADSGFAKAGETVPVLHYSSWHECSLPVEKPLSYRHGSWQLGAENRNVLYALAIWAAHKMAFIILIGILSYIGYIVFQLLF